MMSSGDKIISSPEMQRSDSRDRDIVSAFNGSNHLELARKYNLTTSRIRQILAENTAGQKAGRQGRKKRS